VKVKVSKINKVSGEHNRLGSYTI